MANDVENYLLIKGNHLSEIEKYFKAGVIDFEKIIPVKDIKKSAKIEAWGVKWKPKITDLQDSSENHKVYFFITPGEAPDKIIWKLQKLHHDWFIQDFWIDPGLPGWGIINGEGTQYDRNNGLDYSLEGFSKLLKDYLDHGFQNVLIENCNEELVHLQEMLDDGPDEDGKEWLLEDLEFYRKMKNMIAREWGNNL
jgi:hypothetical protein